MTWLSPDMTAMVARLAREDQGLPDPTGLPADKGRAFAALSNIRWNQDLPPMARARTISHGGLPARYLEPEGDRGTHGILYIHGGGWAFCSPATHEGASRRLADACAAPVIVPDYRLAPEAPWPAGLDDVLTALRACDPARQWIISGDSAGANLALAALLTLASGGGAQPAGAMLFYGVFGAGFDTPSYLECADGPGLTTAKMRHYWDWYAPAELRAAPTVAPLTASDAELAALPPLYLNAAGVDPLRSDSEALAERLAALGRGDVFDLFDGVIHGFMQMGAALPEARAAFAAAGAWFFAQYHQNDHQKTGGERR